MSSGALRYPVGWQGKVHGHDVYVEGRGWVYRPLPKPLPWVEPGDRVEG